ncbi:MAG TPA: lipopolysaccharide assembly protein LapA domain-containing protein [Bradyrhizobium sp.]|nr:lipopolysaccharide assembly protein LapA domain-containing protein [Bradyrhizobium sp.]
MRKFLNAAVMIPVGLILIVFAVANRHWVTVSFDPFNSSDPALGVSLPLFMIIIAALILGVVAGGCATWFNQRRWRRAARQYEAETRRLSAQLTDWRAGAIAPPPEPMPLTAPRGGYQRDKQGATL